MALDLRVNIASYPLPKRRTVLRGRTGFQLTSRFFTLEVRRVYRSMRSHGIDRYTARSHVHMLLMAGMPAAGTRSIQGQPITVDQYPGAPR
jgi:hypothetical protein